MHRAAMRFNGQLLDGELRERGWSRAHFLRLIVKFEDCDKAAPGLLRDWLAGARNPTMPYLYAITQLTERDLSDYIVLGEQPSNRAA